MAVGMAEFLRFLPENHRERARILDEYHRMMAALLKYKYVYLCHDYGFTLTKYNCQQEICLKNWDIIMDQQLKNGLKWNLKFLSKIPVILKIKLYF